MKRPPGGRLYTLTVPRPIWKRARALAILRDQENEEFVLRAVQDELKRERDGKGIRIIEPFPRRVGEDEASYTFAFPDVVYRAIRTYIAKRVGGPGRDPTIRGFLHSVIAKELELARKSGELVTNL